MNVKIKNTLVIFLLIALLLFSIIGLGSALVPLLFAFFLVYLVFPLVKKLEDKGVHRSKSVIAVFVSFCFMLFSMLALVIPSLLQDIEALVQDFPEMTQTALERLEVLSADWGVEVNLSKDSIAQYIEIQRDQLKNHLTSSLSKGLKGVFSGLTQWVLALLNLFLIPLFFFYTINDYEKIRAGIKSYIPRGWLPKLTQYVQLANTVLSGYIRGQLMVASLLAVLYAIGLFAVGLRFGILIGLFSGLISIIPYAGLTIGLLLSLIIALANTSGLPVIIGVLVVFIIVQTLEGIVITPKLVGDKVGLSALTTMLALIIGGNYLGVIGMVIAIPVTAILKRILFDVKSEYQKLKIYQA